MGWVLIACPDSLKDWGGIENGIDVGKLLDNSETTLWSMSNSMLLWYVEDAGSCDVFQYDNIFVLIASWLMPDANEPALEPFVVLPDHDWKSWGRIDCNEDHLVMSWAVDTGAETLSLYEQSGENFIVKQGTLGNDYLPFKKVFQHYHIYIDEIDTDDVMAKRIFLVPENLPG